MNDTEQPAPRGPRIENADEAELWARIYGDTYTEAMRVGVPESASGKDIAEALDDASSSAADRAVASFRARVQEGDKW